MNTPEHPLEDRRCECCGYMTYHREHMGCIRAARAPADILQVAPNAVWHKDYGRIVMREVRTTYERADGSQTVVGWDPITPSTASPRS